MEFFAHKASVRCEIRSSSLFPLCYITPFTQWLHLDLIKAVTDMCRDIFPTVRYAFTTIPTYPSGQIGFIVASNDATVNPSVPQRKLPAGTSLRYYSPAIHRAAFVLPVMTATKLGLTNDGDDL